MKRFKDFISEENSTANLIYFGASGAQFSVDNVDFDFDIEDEDSWEDEHDNMLPWEIENALMAKQRRKELLKWLKAAGGNTDESVVDSSLPDPPEWQKL